MSPEQLSQDAYTKSCDIWAAGCIFFEMIELKRAINAQTLMQCMVIVTTAPTPQLSIPDFQDWQEIVNGMLQKNPSFRSTSKEILQRLQFFDDDKNGEIGKTNAKNSEEKLKIKNIERKTPDPNRNRPLSGNRSNLFSDQDLHPDLTPKQLMMLRKQQKADERARLLSSCSNNRASEIKKNRDYGKKTSMDSHIGNLTTEQTVKLAKSAAKSLNSSNSRKLGGRTDGPGFDNIDSDISRHIENSQNESFESDDTYFENDEDENCNKFEHAEIQPENQPENQTQNQPENQPGINQIDNFQDTFFIDDSIRPGSTVDDFAAYLAAGLESDTFQENFQESYGKQFDSTESTIKPGDTIAQVIYDEDFDDFDGVSTIFKKKLVVDPENRALPTTKAQEKTKIENDEKNSRPTSNTSIDSKRSQTSQKSQNSQISQKSQTSQNSKNSYNSSSIEDQLTISTPINDNHIRVLDQITLSKITRLKEKCINQLGEQMFYQVYEILLEQHEIMNNQPLGSRNPYSSEKFVKIQTKMDDLVPRDVSCMCVDELIYLEAENGMF